MLESIGLLEKEELQLLLKELKNIYEIIQTGDFVIEEGIEDVHSQVELMLTRSLGEMGKKIHSGRSRNDQALLDLKLFARAEIENTVAKVCGLFDVLIAQSNRYKNVLMPGYTHLQIAMKMGDNKVVDVPVISTGSIGLNNALGVGGLPRGRVIEIYGPESSGKTTLAIHVERLPDCARIHSLLHCQLLIRSATGLRGDGKPCPHLRSSLHR